ncbi:hypothetical protein ITI46_26895 [Streptomyces oryzae]|uniref:DUF3558 domain-containing protein n=1 Tax=Streptomyces oryzae TaxID=1434886 RepID=A0ABS3XIX5_9ACTN|nr:hypothetical protein [Streptomyces oryzae]MBO8195249.1 hypothetical protein [Streptomyces oryzae]
MGKRAFVRCGTLAAIVVAATAWLLQPEKKEGLAVPDRVCGGIFSGERVAPLFSGAEGEIKSELFRDFPGNPKRSLAPVCEVYTDHLTVGFRVDHPGYPDSRREVQEDHKYVAELGSAYGAYDKTGGAISLDIPCPSRDEPKATLALNVGASVVRGNVKGSLPKLEDLTGYAARTLAQKVYKCKGAEELPKGPVRITRGEGGR